jgi:hypothetical protein
MATNKWTVMFFFASDNALSPVIVSQLKAIKEAGFHEDVEVLVYFDPSEKGVPTKIYNVNRERKKRRLEKLKNKPALSKNIIGDGKDPFVHNLREDDIKEDKTINKSRPAAKAMFDALDSPDDIDAKEALKLFLNFCRENNQAERYILFLVGHGMIVGNDVFLPDENPVSSITLMELGEILRSFNKDVTADKNAFELLALHSCSMSAIEVAYELKATTNPEATPKLTTGTAKLMMASEGISYVNSWPYRQLLKKLFSAVERAKAAGSSDVDVHLLMQKLYFLSFFNAVDFNLSGYPLDLVLCNLEAEGNFNTLTGELTELVKHLVDGVSNKGRRKELILLAHLEAQSYWGENYTDLLDFCRCLSARCGTKKELATNKELRELSTACDNVVEKLKARTLSKVELDKHESDLQEKLKGIESTEEQEIIKKEAEEELERLKRERRFEGLVIFSRSFGSAYQYSHGLSIYFPWAEPVENVGNGKMSKIREAKEAAVKTVLAVPVDAKVREVLERDLFRSKGILERYAEYAFTKELETEKNSWLSFLKAYFTETLRTSRFKEDHPGAIATRPLSNSSDSPSKTIVAPGGQPGILPTSVSLQKDSPSSGVACICTTIKNYPPPPPESTVKIPRYLSEESSET